MDPGIVIPGILLVGLGLVVVPVLLLALYDAQRDVRAPVEVICPRDGLPAQVIIDPSRLALGQYVPVRQHVMACALWPERKGCARLCELAIDPAQVPHRADPAGL